MNESPTSDLVFDAVQNVLAENGRMLTAMIGVVTYLDENGTRCWAWMVNEAQGPEVTIGLGKVIENICHQISLNSFDIDASTS